MNFENHLEDSLIFPQFFPRFFQNRHLTPGLHSRLGYLSRLLAWCEQDEVRMNVDIHTLVRELSITRQDIRNVLVFFDSGLIYQHVSKSFEMRREQDKSVEDEINVPSFTLSFSSCLILSRWECKPGITENNWMLCKHEMALRNRHFTSSWYQHRAPSRQR